MNIIISRKKFSYMSWEEANKKELRDWAKKIKAKEKGGELGWNFFKKQ